MRINTVSVRRFFLNNWLFLLIISQPLLDILAFWDQNSSGTAAGKIRLAVMIVLPLIMLVELCRRRRYKLLVALLIAGVFCALHVLNGIRVGDYDMAEDVAYMLRVAQMPVLALCFMAYITDEQRAERTEHGLLIAAAILMATLVTSSLTGTATPTYQDGIGISGWVIKINCNSASIILSVLAVFSVLYTLKNKPLYLTLTMIVGSAVFLIANGTKACYLTLLLLCICASAMIVLTWLDGDRGEHRRDAAVLALLVSVCVLSIVFYRYTPCYAEKANVAYTQTKYEAYYDMKYPSLHNGSSDIPEENTPEWQLYIHDMYANFIPEDVRERFGMFRIVRQYGHTDDVGTLMNVRTLKRNYAELVWSETDTLTKLVGFQHSEMNTSGGLTYDLENDWPAIKYYYGYIGLALYIGFIAIVVAIFLLRLIKDFRGAINMRNMGYAMILALELGLAQYSGALLRRPNASFYLAVTLAMLYYENMSALRALKRKNTEEEK